MTTEEAFQQMITERGVYKKLGMNDGTVRSLRRDWRNGKRVTRDKQYELLMKAGWKLRQRSLWDSPSKNKEMKQEKTLIQSLPIKIYNQLDGPRAVPDPELFGTLTVAQWKAIVNALLTPIGGGLLFPVNQRDENVTINEKMDWSIERGILKTATDKR